MDLLPFQSKAASQICDRFHKFLEDPNSPYETKNRRAPFYQNLAGITGSGKTVILADALEGIRESLPVEPLVLWVSKGKVVIEQTLTNLETGKYRDLIPGFSVKALLDCDQSDVESNEGLLLLATVATFNQKDEQRRVFRLSLDRASKSLWDNLKFRENAVGKRRPLIVVYDEGHNLSEQQTDRIIELEPDFLLSASATPRIGGQLLKVIERLKGTGWDNELLTTTVPVLEVVESGLIKSQVVLVAFETEMETAVGDLIKDMADARRAAESLRVPLTLKAIYVCSTNVIDTGKGRGERDDPHKPFEQRRAGPIRIWRHLTENCDVLAEKIAVYCDLHVDNKYPLPADFKLFRGGDGDYEEFVSGGYEHIIFNQSLQEGWDDPQVLFAYIDKSMGSELQITQVIGRVLRQPTGKHFEHPRLNTASFYLRVSNRSTFAEILDEAKTELESTTEIIGVSRTPKGKTGVSRITVEPKKTLKVPRVSVDAELARPAMMEIINSVHDYRSDAINTRGTGARSLIRRRVGVSTNDEFVWEEAAGANRVLARYVFDRHVHSLYPKVINVCDLSNPKFDAIVEVKSIAAQEIEQKADAVVTSYLERCSLKQKSTETYTVGPVFVSKSEVTKFKNALHGSYSSLNALEKEIATAIDSKGYDWCRNPARNGYGIPLLSKGKSRTFYPDFLIWARQNVYAVDPKGDHILAEDAARKLLDIEQLGAGAKVLIRLIAKGGWTSELKRTTNQGFTVFRLKSGHLTAEKVDSAKKAVEACLH